MNNLFCSHIISNKIAPSVATNHVMPTPLHH
nr:MAG TPA: hypothetical protein [Caudoviricetes sp.]